MLHHKASPSSLVARSKAGIASCAPISPSRTAAQYRTAGEGLFPRSLANSLASDAERNDFHSAQRLTLSTTMRVSDCAVTPHEINALDPARRRAVGSHLKLAESAETLPHPVVSF
jgi:hypothetical protein